MFIATGAYHTIYHIGYHAVVNEHEKEYHLLNASKVSRFWSADHETICDVAL